MSDDLAAIYFEEAGDVLRELEEVLLLLDSLPDDRSLIDRLFRAAHTLKGSSAVFGFERVAGFTHHVEDLIDDLRTTGATVTRELTDVLLRASDVMKGLVAEAGGAPPLPEEALEVVLADVRRLRDGSLEAPPLAAGPAPATADAPPPPPADEAEEGERDGEGEIEELSFAGPEPTPQPAPAPAPAAATPEPAAWAPASAPPPAPATASESDLAEAAPAPPPATHRPKPEPARAEEPEAAGARGGKSGGDALSVRVPIEKLERLVNLVGEIVITQSMVAQLVSQLPPGELVDNVVAMGRHCRELQERVLGVRMLPVKTLFGRFQRLVRDTASSLGKRVDLHLSGEETELDKTVIEKIGDPLTHILRNAIDHGIETAEQRLEAGKPAAGRLSLSASQRGGNIYIDVEDDGRGINRQKVLARARERGLIDPGADLSDEEIDQLIFLPGFSTAEKVTELSGRGVGMDVVRRNVDALQGTILVSSSPGKGMRIQIKLPLTLAILEGLVLGVGQQTYVAPLVAVVECLCPRPEQIRDVIGAGQVVDIRGEHMPLVPLHQVFDVQRSEDLSRALVVVLDDGSARMAVLVDELLGQSQVVVKSLENNVGRIQGIAGATILGDGSVALILDAAGLAALWKQRHRAASTRSTSFTQAACQGASA